MTLRPALSLALLLACTAPPPPDPTPAPAAPPLPVTLTVTATLEGASPTEVERSLTTPLEQALANTPDLTDLRSTSRSAHAELVLTFKPGTALDVARVAVHTQLQAAQSALPEQALPPVLGTPPDPHTAVLFILQSAAAAPDELGRTATDLRRSLLTLRGVADVAMCGHRTPKIEISLDSQRLTAYALAADTAVNALRAVLGTNLSLGAGVRMAPAAPDLESLADTVLVTREPLVRLRDVATISSTVALETCGAVRLGGGPAIVAVVHAQRGSSPDDFNNSVRTALAARRPDLHTRQIDLDVPAHALRVALDLEASMDPATSLTDHAGRLHALLAADKIQPLAYLQAPTPAMFGEWYPGDLFLLPSSAAEAAQLRETLAARKNSVIRTIGSPADPAADPQLHRTWITGPDRETDVQIATYVADMLRGVPGVTRSRLRDDQTPERILSLDRDKLAALGLNAADVRTTLAVALGGLRVGTILDRDVNIPVFVRLPANDTVQPMSPLQSLTVQPTNGGAAVPLSTLVKLQLSIHPAELHHFNRQRAVLIEWFSADQGARKAATDKVARELQLPAGVAVIWE